MIMEFREYDNPEEKDYDLKQYENEYDPQDETILTPIQALFSNLWCDLGFPEIEELESYGMTEALFENPNKQSIDILKAYQRDHQKHR